MPTVALLTTTGSGSWTVPAGVTSVQVEVWGGGGGRNPNWSNYPGGGGAYSKKNTIAVTPGASIPYNVGVEGNNTRHGGDSWFLTIATVLAKGGQTSYGSGDGTINNIAQGGSASAGVGDLRFSGGGTSSISGCGGGASASSTGNGGNGTSGVGGSSPGAGAGGAANQPGSNNVEGGGGGGGHSGTPSLGGRSGGSPGGGVGQGSSQGQLGGRGQIRITYEASAEPEPDPTPIRHAPRSSYWL